MKTLLNLILTGTPLLLHYGLACAQANVAKVFLLEDATKNQWCAFKSEVLWNAAVQDARSMAVATLAYSNDRLSQIDLTQTDEAGDWIMYDHYFFDNEQLVKVSRTINVLPGDRSTLQTFSISNGKATKIGTTSKQLSTGKNLNSPKPIWLPVLPIKTSIQMFPFSALLGRSNLRASDKSCVRTTNQRSRSARQ